MIRLFDDGLGGKQGVPKDKIRQVRMLQRHRTQEQRFSSGRIRRDIRLLSSTAGLGMYVFK